MTNLRSFLMRKFDSPFGNPLMTCPFADIIRSSCPLQRTTSCLERSRLSSANAQTWNTLIYVSWTKWSVHASCVTQYWSKRVLCSIIWQPTTKWPDPFPDESWPWPTWSSWDLPTTFSQTKFLWKLRIWPTSRCYDWMVTNWVVSSLLCHKVWLTALWQETTFRKTFTLFFRDAELNKLLLARICCDGFRNMSSSSSSERVEWDSVYHFA